MFVGVPAGIITVLLVLAAFLVAPYGPSFREGNSLPAISGFCNCNLYFTCTCDSFVPAAGGIPHREHVSFWSYWAKKCSNSGRNHLKWVSFLSSFVDLMFWTFILCIMLRGTNTEWWGSKSLRGPFLETGHSFLALFQLWWQDVSHRTHQSTGQPLTATTVKAGHPSKTKLLYPNSFCFINLKIIINEAKSTLKIKSEKDSDRSPRTRSAGMGLQWNNSSCNFKACQEGQASVDGSTQPLR